MKLSRLAVGEAAVVIRLGGVPPWNCGRKGAQDVCGLRLTDTSCCIARHSSCRSRQGVWCDRRRCNCRRCCICSCSMFRAHTALPSHAHAHRCSDSASSRTRAPKKRETQCHGACGAGRQAAIERRRWTRWVSVPSQVQGLAPPLLLKPAQCLLPNCSARRAEPVATGPNLSGAVHQPHSIPPNEPVHVEHVSKTWSAR